MNKKDVYPQIRSELVLTSVQDLDKSVYDCLKDIRYDQFRVRRTKEVDHPVYLVDANGQLAEWEGTECVITFSPKPFLAVEDAFEEMYQKTEPHLFVIRRLIQRFALEATVIFDVFLGVYADNDPYYPVMTITKKMIQFANEIGAEIQISCEIDEDLLIGNHAD